MRPKSPTMPAASLSSSPPSPRPRPVASRAQTSVSANSLAIPSTPFYTPQVSSVNVNHQKRLLLPTVRPVRPQTVSPRFSGKSTSKPVRSRTGSVSANASPDPQERPTYNAASWFPGGEKFEIVEEQLELEGFQIYAVEKWCAWQGAWEDAMRALRRDGARPKETEKGVLMVTSLANFRSDYTIVHVPSGNFLDVREQLYTNVNLLRMGCGGRSALTLEEPSDATKDRFIAMYHVIDKAPARSGALFNTTVLELVRLIQAALAIFGMFDLAPEERNGLLCDVTCEGIQKWVTEIGEPYLKIEPTEKVADPSVIAALFSLILSTRSKLHALGLVVPKDPFLEPTAFVRVLGTFLSSKSHPHGHSPHSHHHHHQSHPASPTHSSPIGPSAAAAPSVSTNSITVYLTQPLIESIEAQYEKVRQSESYKVHRVLKNKLDDLATDLRTHATDNINTGISTLSVTSDLSAFVRCVVSTKDAPQSLRYLWTGRPGYAEKKRREKEGLWSDGEREREERDRENEGERDGMGKDGRDKDDKEKERDKELREPGDEDEALSSGQQSPVFGSLPHAERSVSDISEYDRRVTEFNQKRPTTRTQSRVISWSDARSARSILHDNGSNDNRVGASPLGGDSSSSPGEDDEFEAEEEEGLPHLPGMEVDSDEEVDAVEHHSLKPTWLLRFFNYWGSKLGLGRGGGVPNSQADGQAKAAGVGSEDESKPHKQDAGQQNGSGDTLLSPPSSGVSSSVGLPTDDTRPQMLQRTVTT
ncbi:hypothetical protein BN946_scf184858.g44 [Trametes cinnabarina]|uniref:STB6-like N-terminal domain-containing protein n=1 Tax=Pycnoporus cinnabarinus TaxID=5643 RepID=A0A060STN9_PYCCI|nr:hypothetical protein BN946_scf184858.g44 [Trametes cinnabarina]